MEELTRCPLSVCGAEVGEWPRTGRGAFYQQWKATYLIRTIWYSSYWLEDHPVHIVRITRYLVDAILALGQVNRGKAAVDAVNLQNTQLHIWMPQGIWQQREILRYAALVLYLLPAGAQRKLDFGAYALTKDPPG